MTRHVIWDNLVARGPLTLAPEQQLVLKCTHCGERYVAALPCTVGMMSAVTRQYIEDHRNCRQRPPLTDERQAWRANLLGCLAMRHAAELDQLARGL